MKKWKKILLGIVLALILLVFAGAGFLRTQTHAADAQAVKVAKTAKDEGAWLSFPSNDKTKPMVVFYPGALVAPESYSIWAQELAEAGYPVYIIKMPLDLAVMAPNRGEKVLEKYSDRPYVIGGHSLGGVMASRFAAQHEKNCKGVFFMGSYPDEKGSLAKDATLPVLSLTGENDHVLDQSAYEKAKKDLPKDTEYEEISGGNHAGFGAYGKQQGDGKSTIDDQNQQVADRMLKWLKDVQ